MDFLKQCFRRISMERPSSLELLSHPWLEKHKHANPADAALPAHSVSSAMNLAALSNLPHLPAGAAFRGRQVRLLTCWHMEAQAKRDLKQS